MTTCTTSNAPINLPKIITQQCSSKCNLEYNYGLSSCSVTNKKTYLDISSYDGTNNVNSDMIGQSLEVTGVRLYAPSLNSYNGFKADAELIITHTGNGQTLYICIPVVSSEKDGLSAKWFNQVIPFLSGLEENGIRIINVNNFTLNDVIPKSSFTIYENATFDFGGCAEDNKIILFHKNVAINMKTGNYDMLTKLISSSSYAINDSNLENLQINIIGTTLGPGKKSGGSGGKSMTCTPINNSDGTSITGSKNSLVPPVSNDTSVLDNGYYGSNTLLVWVLIIFAAMIVVGLLGWLLHYVFSKNNQSPTTSSPMKSSVGSKR
jgi:carbonic anhydrase